MSTPSTPGMDPSADIVAAVQNIQVDRKPFDGEVYDVMGGSGRWEVKVHDHGLVALLDVMPRFAPVGLTHDGGPALNAR